MPQPKSVSLAKFTTTVQAAVKAAVAKHPQIKVEAPQAIAESYLIRGIPVPDNLVAKLPIGDAQAFASEVAGAVSAAHPGLVGGAGAVLSVGGHLILGFPVPPEVLTIGK